jgi:gliding motility-associated-like protein
VLSNAGEVSNLKPGDYYIKVVDGRSCKENTVVSVKNPEKFIGLYLTSPFNCYLADVSFSALNGELHLWKGPYWSSTSKNAVLDKFTEKDTGRYILNVRNNKGCLFEDTFNLSMFKRPKLSYKNPICEGESVFISVDQAKSVTWSLPNNKSHSGASYFQQKSSSSDSGNYSIVITTSENCKDTLNGNIMVVPKVQLSLKMTNNGLNCVEDDVVFDFTTNRRVYNEWYSQSGKLLAKNQPFYRLNNVSSKDQGVYKLKFTDEFGCIDSINKFLKISEKPKAQFEVLPSPNCIYAGFTQAKLVDFSEGVKQTNFYINDSLISERNRSVMFIPKERGNFNYKMKVQNFEGCWDSLSIQVTIDDRPKVFVPNAFTPNSDLINPIFKPVFNLPVKSYKLRVYNRWGEKLYDDMNSGWDGSFEGKPAQEGVYVCILEYEDSCGEKYNHCFGGDFTNFSDCRFTFVLLR